MEKDTPHQYLYGTQTNTVIQVPNIADDSVADTGFGSLANSMFAPWI